MRRTKRKTHTTMTPRPGIAAPLPQARLWPAGSLRKIWGFRLAAFVAAPLLILVGFEMVLRLLGLGYPAAFFLHRQVNGQKVLVENQRFGWRFFTPAAARQPRPLLIPAVKPPSHYRVFILGESAAFGDPQPDFGLPRLLQVLLKERYPGTHFEVVNAAMTAINSHVILPIARECSQHQGDLWILYLGNNEVVGPFGAGTVFGPQAPGLPFIRANLALKTLKIGQWLDALWHYRENRSGARQEWQGLRMFVQHRVRQDDPRLAAVYRHFERNLEAILKAGVSQGVKMVVSTMVSNLKDCAPFASMHRTGLAPAQESEWNRFYQAGIEAELAGETGAAVEMFQKAGAIDDQYAELQFRWGRCCLALGENQEARKHLTLARDQDVLRFRADTRINDLIRKTARSRENEGIYLVDAEEILARESPQGLPGAELLYEHVHLNFEGNYRLGRLLAERVANLLPISVASRIKATHAWMTQAECAHDLAWTDWNRRETLESLLIRLNDPPFTDQLNQAEQRQLLRSQLEALAPALQAPGLQQAAANYRQALARAPDDWVLHLNFGRLQQELGESAGAIESWRRAVLLLPHLDEAVYQSGRLLSQLGRFDEAIQHYRRVLKHQPDFYRAMNGLGLALIQLGNYPEALKQFRLALEVKPDYPETHLNLGNALKALGRSDEANRHFRQALQHKINIPGALIALGNACAAQGWTNEAITNYTEAVRLAPTDALAHLALGSALANVGRRAEACRSYAEAVRLKPDSAEAHFKLGLELGRQGKDAEALQEFAKAVQFKPDLAEAHLNLGIALLKQQKLAEAIRCFEEVLRLSPTNAIADRYLKAIQGSSN